MSPDGSSLARLVELVRYAELLVFLAGTLLYGFLTRELLRRPQVLPGNWPLRCVPISLAIWYAGALADELVAMLVGDPSLVPRGLALLLDLGRAFAWLASLGLLVHALARIWIELAPPGDRLRGRLTGRLAPVPGYLTLGLFVVPALTFARSGSPYLADGTREAGFWILIHALATLPSAALLALGIAGRVRDPRMGTFLRMLAASLVALLTVLVLGTVFDPWTARTAGERLLRTLVLSGLLVPGALLAYYVQRYNLLRLSLSHRTLRHFVSVLAVVSLLLLLGPALGMDGMTQFRRFVAWGLVLALAAGTLYRPIADRLLAGSPALRRLAGRAVAPAELDRLMETIQTLELDEREAMRRTAEEIGRWLGCDASFLPHTDADPTMAPFWEHAAEPDAGVVHRLEPPSARLAVLLTHHGLHAVLPLRVAGQLRGLLGLSASAIGGGYADGELAAVQLVVRQLAGTLALRRLLDRRLAEERRLAEHERLGLLGLVTASLAHELKNPLSSIKVLAQALREELAASEDHLEGVADLDVIVEQIDRLDQTAREILGLARPQPGGHTDLVAVVESAAYVLQAEARKRAVGLRAEIATEGGGCRATGSAAAWQTVVFNLALNALTHTAAGLETTLDLAFHDHQVRFEVRNPGSAIPPERARRLFEPFVSDRRDGRGTGLGLALVARRVAELGGTITVDHRDGEVVFRVEAPCAEETAP